MARKKLIAANWKMYKNPAQTEEFFRAFLPLVFEHNRDEIVVCPPYVDLQAALESAKGSQKRRWNLPKVHRSRSAPRMCTGKTRGRSPEKFLPPCWLRLAVRT